MPPVSREFLEYKADIITKLNKIQLQLSDCKEIDYGELLIFESAKIELKITLYYNKKNHFKYIINKVTPPIFKDFIENTLFENELLENSMTEMNSDDGIESDEVTSGLVAGSDESGKGDYFGPLVVVAFVCGDRDIPRLKKYGVKDSKLLSDEKIIQLGEKIFLDFKGRYQYIVLKPEKYNELYEKFSTHKPGLNEMLAWLHSCAISDLYSRHRFDKVIIDKFANEQLISYYVSKKCDVKMQIMTKAESNISVAVASILARYLYIKKMEELSENYSVKLLKGASQQVKELRDSIPQEQLPFLIKMHFK